MSANSNTKRAIFKAINVIKTVNTTAYLITNERQWNVSRRLRTHLSKQGLGQVLGNQSILMVSELLGQDRIGQSQKPMNGFTLQQ